MSSKNDNMGKLKILKNQTKQNQRRKKVVVVVETDTEAEVRREAEKDKIEIVMLKKDTMEHLVQAAHMKETVKLYNKQFIQNVKISGLQNLLQKNETPEIVPIIVQVQDTMKALQFLME